MKKPLQKMSSTLTRSLGEHAEQFLSETMELLLKSAEQAHNTMDQNEFFRAMGIIRDHGKTIIRKWLSGVRAQVQSLKPGALEQDPSTADFDSNNMGLMDVTTLNDWVLIVRVASKVEASFSGPLYELEQRLGALLKHPVSKEENPFGPVTILRIFKEIMDGYSPPGSCQPLILRCLEQEILRHLGPVYLELNEILKQHGVCPDLKLRPKKVPTPQLGDDRHSPSPSPQPREDASSDTAPPPTNDDSERLESSSMTRPRDPEFISHVDRSSNMIKEMIGTMRLDQSLPQEVHEMVEQLDEPLNNLAKIQPDFLLDPDHPATEVINNLERLSLAVAAENSSHGRDRRLHKAIEAALTELGTNTEGALAAFTAAREKLSHVVMQYEHGFRANTERLREKYHGQEKLAQARQRVAEIVNRHLAQKEVPRCLLKLFGMGWSSLLTLTFLSKGTTSKEWERYLETIDQLLAWFDDIAPPPPEELETVDRLLDDLRLGFSKIPSTSLEQDRLIDNIASALQGNWPLFRRMKGDRVLVDEGFDIHKDMTQVDATGEVSPTVAQDWRQTIRTIQIGDWMLQRLPNSESRHVNLCWADEQQKHFVFVDAKGMQVLDLDLEHLIACLQTGTLELLEDGRVPLMQRSIQRVLNSSVSNQPSETGIIPLPGSDSAAGSESPVPRRILYGIMLTDIVGYSRMMEEDEEQAFELLQAHNKLVRERIEKYQGEEIKTIGDAFLLVFSSAINAAYCAAEIHADIAALNERSGDKMKLALRIGIHVGDVIRMDRDVFGDGINVVSRIEPLATPGGTCISEVVYNLIRKQVNLKVEEMALCNLKNISLPPKLYQLLSISGD